MISKGEPLPSREAVTTVTVAASYQSSADTPGKIGSNAGVDAARGV